MRIKESVFQSRIGRQFFSGVFFLTLSNVLTKVCGLFLKVPLTHMLGDDGMGYFNLAYAVYKWFYMISTAGLPVAAAVMTARYAAETTEKRGYLLRRMRNVTLGSFCAVGLAGSLCMWIGAPLFASLQKVDDASYAIAAIAPALFFICIASALRGWYQGLGTMLPASVSQVIEAVAKMGFGLLLGAYAIRRGKSLCVIAAYAISGLSIGSFLGMLVMLAAMLPVQRKHGVFKTERPRNTEPWTVLLGRLWRFALPVTFSASVMSLCDMLDSMIVIRRLSGCGVPPEQALRLFGNYTSLAVPMFNLPPILIYPVTTALIPIITAASGRKKDGNRKRDEMIRTALIVTSWIALPCTAGMSVLAKPLLSLLYREDLAATGAPLLQILAFAVYFLLMLAMTNAILQATDHARYPVYSMILGAVVKLVSSWILTGRSEIGILGTPISTVLCYAAMAMCNLYFVLKKTDVKLPLFSTVIYPAAASAFCAFSARACHRVLLGTMPDVLLTLLAVCIGAAVYAVWMLFFCIGSRSLLHDLKKAFVS